MLQFSLMVQRGRWWEYLTASAAAVEPFYHQCVKLQKEDSAECHVQHMRSTCSLWTAQWSWLHRWCHLLWISFLEEWSDGWGDAKRHLLHWSCFQCPNVHKHLQPVNLLPQRQWEAPGHKPPPGFKLCQCQLNNVLHNYNTSTFCFCPAFFLLGFSKTKKRSLIQVCGAK